MNARSIYYKLTQIIDEFPKANIVCASESWLNETHSDGELTWPGKTLFRMDREADKAGGVLMFVDNEIASHVTVIEKGTFVNENTEMLTILIEKPQVKRKLVISVYKPPKGDVEKFAKDIDNTLDDMDTFDINVWVGGGLQCQFCS